MRFGPKLFLASFLAMAAMPLVVGCGGGDNPSDEPAANSEAATTGAQAAVNQSPAQPNANDPLHPLVVLDTSLGKITLRLDAEKAPLTVDNFLEYVDSGHYDETIFHQVIKDYPSVALGGAFTPQLAEKPAGQPVYSEAHNGLKNRRGTIAMARQSNAIDSATCHFFLNLTDNEVLDHKDRTLDGYGYCVFGEVVDGLDVIDKIGAVSVHDADDFEQIPVDTVVIRSVQRVGAEVARRPAKQGSAL